MRIDAYGEDGFVSPLFAGSKYVVTDLAIGNQDDEAWVIKGQNSQAQFFEHGITNLIKFLGISMIPIFIFSVPISTILVLKNRGFFRFNMSTLTIFAYSFTLLIPAFYAYGRHIEELRYVFILYPIFSILSLFLINKIHDKIKNHSIITTCIIIGVVILSVGFLEYKNFDYTHEREAFHVTKEIVKNGFVYNVFSPESKYIKSAEVYDEWPLEVIFAEGQGGHIKKQTIGIHNMNFDSLEEFLSQSKDDGLTHLVVDDKKRIEYLSQVFNNEEDFPYLKKVFDSKQDGLEYHVKIFEINYEKFLELEN